MIEILDEVTIYDTLSLFDECTGIVVLILENGIYKVEFPDGQFGFFEGRYLY